MPVVTRLYAPDALGILGGFAAIMGILSPAVAFSYPMAIVLPSADSEARSLVQLSLLIASALSLILGVVLLAYAPEISRMIGWRSHPWLLYLVPPALFLAALCETQRCWAFRKKNFRLTAQVDVIQTLLLNLAKVGGAFVQATGTVLVLIAVIGSALRAFLFHRGLQCDQTWTFKDSPRIRSLLEVARNYQDFAFFRCPQILINALSQHFPVLFLGIFFGTAAAGFYTLGKLILAAPIRLVGKSVGEVFYPDISEVIRSGAPAFPILFRATLVMLAVGAPIFATIILWGPQLFAYVFGADWEFAGEYARWLAPWMYLNFANHPCVAAVPALRLHRGLLIFEIFSTTSKLLALYGAFVFFAHDLWTVATLGVVGAVAYFFLILWVLIEALRMSQSPKVN